MSATVPSERFFNVSDDLLFVLGPDSRIKEANPAMLSLLGYSPDELSAAPVIDFIHEDDREKVRADLGGARGGGRMSLVARLRGKDGSYKLLHWSGTSSRGDGHAYIVARFVASPLVAEPILASDGASDGRGSGDEFFGALVRHMAAVLGVKHAFISQCADSPLTRVRTIAGWMVDKNTDNFEYPLAGTPCEKVLTGQECYFGAGVQAAFPDDQFLIDIACESYIGVPLVDPSGALLGHLCALDDKPFRPEDRGWQAGVLRAFADWAVAEIERLHADEGFRSVMEATAALSGGDFLNTLARKISEVLRLRYTIIAEYMDRPATRARALAFWNGEKLINDYEYDLEGTPCSVAAKGETCFFPDLIQQMFPRDAELVVMNARSYLGVPLFDTHGTQIGQIAVLDTEPMTARVRRLRMLKLFATRTAAELERLRTEAAAKETEVQLKLIIEHAADALFVSDRSGEIIDVNPAAAESLGYEREDLIGKNIALVRDGASDSSVLREIESLRPGEPRTFEQRHRRRDGRLLDVEVRTVLFEVSGRALVLSIARDVTERRRAELAREEAMREMSTPILEVWDGIVTMPVIGTVDELRAAQMMETLLNAIAEARAGFAILDLTGVKSVDASTAGHLLRMVRGAALLGSRCLISGISAQMASTLVELGAEAGALATFGTLQSALKHAIRERSGKGSAPPPGSAHFTGYASQFARR